jgi:hypothetical protein
MKNSQIHQCQIQYYDYNTTEGSHEILFQTLLFPFSEQQKVRYL